MSRRAEVDEAVNDVDFDNQQYQIHLKTNMGDIHLDLDPSVAPGHCRNIIGLTKIGYYDGLIFHRVIDGFMIQGGCPNGTGAGGPGYAIDAEFNDTPHELGVLSAARTSDPNSAGSQFFICLAKHDYLDGQYTVFGKATDDSIEVVKKIGGVSKDAQDRPHDDVVIESATVVTK